MMNARILELIKYPASIQAVDLPLLEKEISAHPYMQSLRALKLLGLSRFDNAKYAAELTTTAAYTTDKKILYQLINGRIMENKDLNEIETTVEKSINSGVEVMSTKVSDITNDETGSETTDISEIVENSHTVSTSKTVEGANKLEENINAAKSENTAISDELNKAVLTEQPQKAAESLATIETEAKNATSDVSEAEEKQEAEKSDGKEAAAPGERLNSEQEQTLKREEIVQLGKATSNQISDVSELEEKVEAVKSDLPRDVETIFSTGNSMQNSADQQETIGRIEVQPTHILIQGERNRILFEGEEDFLQSKQQAKIDLEMTREAGKIVTEKSVQLTEIPTADDIEVLENAEAKVIQEYSENIVIDLEHETPDAVEQVESSAVSFVAFDEFLPEVKMVSKPNESSAEPLLPENSGENRHEIEMKKLLAEVERKIQEKKALKVEKLTEETDPENHEVNFSETQSFEFENAGENVAAVQVVDKNEILAQGPANKIQTQSADAAKEIISTPKNPEFSTWKPMQVLQTSPDTATTQTESRINDSVAKENSELKPEQSVALQESSNSEDGTKQMVEKISVVQQPLDQKNEYSEADQNSKNQEMESNVPKFINTWQNWLKITPKKDTSTAEKLDNEQKVEEITEPIANVKEIAIEKFIENEPKISPLKEETSFVLKERSDDISHLMTETLAGIYAEQKLYAKSIKAFELLKQKHPEKSDYFQSKIDEVKEIRSKNQFNS